MSTLSTTNLKNPSSGSNNIVLATDGSATIATLSSTTITGTTIQGTIKSGTAVSASGTSIDFTSIPSWVKRITVMFDGVSTSGTSLPQIQIGDSGGFETSSYTGKASNIATSSVTVAAHNSGFLLSSASGAASTRYGTVTLNLLNSSSNLWACTGILTVTDADLTVTVAGTKALSGTLDRVRITTVGGSDTFDAGTINILYEG